MKARGATLGNPENLSADTAARGRAVGAQRVREMADEAYADLVEDMRSQRDAGRSLREIAAALNAEGHTTRRGRPWNPMQIARVLDR